MPYSNKQMLRDANGDLIPQYWDVVEQDFKPLTGQGGANDVRLTGSNVLLLKSEEDNNLFNELSNRGFVYLGENVSVSTAGIQPFSLKNSGKRSVLIKNNTDVEIKISGWHIFSDSKQLGVSPTDIRVASGATAFVSSESEVEVLSYPAIRAAITIVGRPTEGSLSIYVFGR